MKKIFALFSGWALFLMPLCAQTPAVAPENRTLPAKSVTDDPSVLAMRESQRLQQQLSLDAKQTKKVYKLYYKHFKKQTPQSQGFGGPGMGGPGGMGRGPGMGGPGGMPGGGPGGFGEPGARHPGSELPGQVQSQGPSRQVDADEMRRAEETWREQQAKKFRKIFTSEQYAAWEQMIQKLPRPESPAKGPVADKPGLRSENPAGPGSERKDGLSNER